MRCLLGTAKDWQPSSRPFLEPNSEECTWATIQWFYIIGHGTLPQGGRLSAGYNHTPLPIIDMVKDFVQNDRHFGIFQDNVNDMEVEYNQKY